MTKSLSIAVLVTCSFVMCGSSFAQQLTPQQAEAKRFLEEERKLAKQAGLPLSPKDLKEAVVPASQNLATYLTEFSNRKNKKVLGNTFAKKSGFCNKKEGLWSTVKVTKPQRRNSSAHARYSTLFGEFAVCSV